MFIKKFITSFIFSLLFIFLGNIEVSLASNVGLQTDAVFKRSGTCQADIPGVSSSSSTCMSMDLTTKDGKGLTDYTFGDDAKDGNSMFRTVFKKLSHYTKRLLIPITILLFVWAGIYLLINRNDENELEEKKNFIFGVFAGFTIILLAPNLVDFVFFGDSGQLLNDKDSTIFARRGVLEIRGLIHFVKSFVVVVAVMFLIFSAYQLIFGGESEEEISKAKKRVIFSIIGITMIVGADQIIQNFFVLDQQGNIGMPNAIGILQGLAHWSNVLLGFLGVIGVLAIVWAGVQMIIHFGDEEKITKSKNIIMYVVIGLAIATVAWTIVRFFLNPGNGG